MATWAELEAGPDRGAPLTPASHPLPLSLAGRTTGLATPLPRPGCGFHFQLAQMGGVRIPLIEILPGKIGLFSSKSSPMAGTSQHKIWTASVGTLPSQGQKTADQPNDILGNQWVPRLPRLSTSSKTRAVRHRHSQEEPDPRCQDVAWRQDVSWNRKRT